MNYPVWDVPAPGLLIAAVAIVHVFISHFAVGGGLFLVLAERKARREGDGALLGFVRRLSLGFALLTLVTGALTGVGIWFTIGLVQPQATSALVATFVWVWAIEWTFFAVEIAAAIVYVHGWETLDARTHVKVGWIYFVAAWASLVAISGILSFMLTAGDWPRTQSLLDAWWNPTVLPMIALRTAVAVGLAGLYVLFAASFARDRALRGRVAAWATTRWIAPAAVAIPLVLLWYLGAADRAGVAVAETLGAESASPVALVSAVFGTAAAGQPIVRGAARVALAGIATLFVLALVVGLMRPRRYGRLEASALMALGLVSVGASEWVREGLRKPWVIDRYMFVNGVRVPATAADPFALPELERRGVLATARFAAAPAAWRPGDAAFEELPAAGRAALTEAAGRAIFQLECAVCHTERGHLGIRPRVAGKSTEAIAGILDRAAAARTATGEPGSWADPDVRVATWLGRRMPPFAGTAAEKRALAVHLARLGGDATAGLEPASSPPGGVAVFETHCAACHGPESAWPIEPRLRGRSADELYALIGRLPEVREEMPPFSGTEEDRRALSAYLGGRSQGPDALEVTP
jgi:mono/diheme cytochrome c family protein/cytochrome bd-type quinol oxidase subunit 1